MVWGQIAAIGAGAAASYFGGRNKVKAPQINVDELGRKQAKFNRIGTESPWGSVKYEGANRNKQVTTLSPEQQKIYDARVGNQQLSHKLAGNIGRQSLTDYVPIGTEGLQEWQGLNLQGGITSPQDRAKQIYEASQGLRRDDKRTRANMFLQNQANRGFAPNSSSSLENRRNYVQDEAQGEADASLRATIAGEDWGLKANSQQLQDAIAQGGYHNALRQAQLNERIGINESRSRTMAQYLANGGREMVPNAPAPGMVDVVNPTLANQQANFQANQTNTQNKNQFWNSIGGGLMQAGAGGFGGGGGGAGAAPTGGGGGAYSGGVWGKGTPSHLKAYGGR